MSQESFQSKPKETHEEVSLSGLKTKMQDASLPLEERITATNELIRRYEKLIAGTNDVILKIDLAEAQTYKAELERGQKSEEMDLDFTRPEAFEGIEVREVTDPKLIEEILGLKTKAEALKVGTNDSTFDGDAFDGNLRATGELYDADRLDAARNRKVA